MIKAVNTRGRGAVSAKFVIRGLLIPMLLLLVFGTFLLLSSKPASATANFTVSGTVTAGGTPVSGANVWLNDPATKTNYGSSPTDASGAFSISVPGGSYMLGASAAGYAMYQENLVVSGDVAGHTIALTSGFIISGTVTSNGNPVSGANVWLNNQATNMSFGGPPTDATGVYSIAVSAGSYQLMASAPGLTQYTENLTISGNMTNHAVVMASGFTVSGIVSNASGPVAGVNVWLNTMTPNPPFSGPPTGSNGQFSITVPSGTYQLGASAPGYAMYQTSVTVNGASVTQNISLSSGYTVSGVVSNASGPVAGANVWLNNPMSNSSYGGPPTGASGQFSITVTNGTYQLMAMAAGYTQYNTNVTVNGASVTQNISLSSGYTVSGIVSNASGPVAGVNVWLNTMTPNPPFSGPPTGSNGQFSITVPSGTYQLGASAPGYAMYQTSVTVNGASVTQNISLSSGYTVSGVVSNASGPVAGANVWLNNPMSNSSYGGPPTGASGQFSITVTNGTYQLMAMAAGYTQYNTNVTVNGASVTQNISLSSGYTVSGIVSNASGPVAGVNVWLNTMTPNPPFSGPPTGSNGQFSITVPSGTYQLGASAPGYAMYQTSVTVNGASVTQNISLSSGYTVSGVVSNASGPVAGANVWLNNPMSNSSYGGPPTGASGQFSITVTNGTYQLMAMAAGYTQYNTNVTVNGASVTQNISLSSGYTVSGIVSNASGPVAGVNVWLNTMTPNPPFSGPPTGSNGQFSITVPSGTYQLGASAPGYAMYQTSVTVNGASVTQNISLSSGYTVSGVVSNASGPVAGANVWLNNPMSNSSYGGPPTGASGQFSITVTNGTYQLMAMAAGYTQYNTNVTVNGASVTQNISLSSGYTVSGIVSNASGPVAGVNVWLNTMTPNPPFSGPPTGSNGQFSITVPSGTYQLGASAPGYAMYQTSVTVNGASVTQNISLSSGYTVSGVVSNASGPVAGANVWLNNPMSNSSYGGPPTGASGQFSITVTNGTYQLMAMAAGYTQYNTNVTVNGASVTQNISLFSGYTVSGIVSNASGPVAGVNVWLNTMTPNPPFSGPPTGSNGQFSITVPSGTYQLGASAPGYAMYQTSVTVNGASVTQNISLSSGYTVSGVVSNASGPVAGANVWLNNPMSNSSYGGPPTGASGQFSITVTNGTYQLMAMAAGYTQYNTNVTVNGASVTQNISLSSGYTVSGIVSNASGPVAGVNVWLNTMTPNPPFSGPPTGSNGQFSITVPSGTYQLGASAPGYAMYQTSVTVNGASVTQNISLSSGYTVSGVVSNASGPVAGANVWLNNPMSNSSYGGPPTGASGQFSITVTNGTYQLMAMAAGYTQYNTNVTVNGASVTQNISLSSGYTVSGIVSNASGPVAGVNVWLNTMTPNPPFSGPPTGSNGQFSITVPSGTYQLGASAPGYAMYQTSVTVNGASVTQNISLSSGYTVSGVVSNASGPVAGANVWLNNPMSNSSYGGPPTGASGQFSITVTNGTYQLMAMAAGYTQYNTNVTVNGASVTQNISLSSGYTVSGIVSNASGPVAGVNVWLNTMTPNPPFSGPPTGSNGQFSITVPSGTYQLGASAPGYAMYQTSVTVNGASVTQNISLSSGYTVSGVVSNASGPVAGANVWLNNPMSNSSYGGPPTGASGQFSITVTNGTYQLMAMAAGYTQYNTNVTVNGASVTQNISLSSGYTVSGIVSNASGPVAGVNVWLNTMTPNPPFSGPPTGSNGQFSITVPSGTYQLGASAPGYAMYQTSVTVNGASVTQNISLSSGYTVSGVVSNASGPVAGANVWLNNPMSNSSYGGPPTGASGQFSITVTNGTYQLMAMAAGYTQYNTNVTVNGASVTQNISLSSGYTVSGVVKDSITSAVIQGANVWIFDPTSGNSWGGPPTSSNGQFSITVANGTYQLCASASNHAAYRTSITVNGANLAQNITLATGYVVSGIVSDGNVPVAGANVWLGDPINQVSYGSPLTGADGSYSIIVSSGSYNLSASASGYALYQESLSVSGNVTGHTITLTSGFTVSGTVTDKGTSALISGANVWLFNQTTGISYSGPPTRADGSYSITVALGTYTLGARATGYAQYAENMGTISSPVSAHAINLVTGFTVQGIVQDTAQVPLFGVNVSLHDQTNNVNYGAPLTKSDGGYSITVPSGSYQLNVTAPGFAYNAGQNSNPANPIAVSANMTVPITMVGGLAVTGTVTNSLTAADLQGVGITFKDLVRGTSYSPSNSAADGTYNVSVPAATYQVSLRLSGYIQYGGIVTISAPGTQNFAMVPLSSGGTTNGYIITGQLTDNSTPAVALGPNQANGGGVVFIRDETKTYSFGQSNLNYNSVNGQYSINVAPGTYTLEARDRGYASYSQVLTVTNSGATINIALAPGGYTVSGTVVDTATLLPVAGASVELTNTGLNVVYHVGMTGLDGSFTTWAVPSGTYQMAIGTGIASTAYNTYTETLTIGGNITGKNITLTPTVLPQVKTK